MWGIKLNIKTSLGQQELEDFKKSEDWLDKWKRTHGIREMERLRGLCGEYDLKNFRDSGSFFKSLPSKGLAKKEKKKQRWKEIEVASDCCFFRQYWWWESWQTNCHLKKQKPSMFSWSQCCKKLGSSPLFFEPKVLVHLEIMEKILEQLNRPIIQE